MKKAVAILAATGACVALAGPATAGTKNVRWAAGSKSTVSVGRGGAVKFVWGDRLPHNLVIGRSVSGTVRGRGKSAVRRFSRSATVYCSYHSNMKVVVRVR